MATPIKSIFALDNQYRNPLNTKNTMSLANKIPEALDELKKSIRDANSYQKNRPKYYGGDKKKRPQWARFKLACYFGGYCKGAHSPYPSYDDHPKFENGIKHNIHDEQRGLNNLIGLTVKKTFETRYKSMVIYCDFSDTPRTDGDGYNYMINMFVDGKWKYPWKNLWFIDGYLNKFETLERNSRFNDRGWPINPEINNQSNLI